MTAAPAKTHHAISLPLAVAVSILSDVASAGAAYGVSTQRHSSSEAQAARNEKRIDKLEDAVGRITPMLERIDERTKRLAKEQ